MSGATVLLGLQLLLTISFSFLVWWICISQLTNVNDTKTAVFDHHLFRLSLLVFFCLFCYSFLGGMLLYVLLLCASYLMKQEDLFKVWLRRGVLSIDWCTYGYMTAHLFLFVVFFSLSLLFLKMVDFQQHCMDLFLWPFVRRLWMLLMLLGAFLMRFLDWWLCPGTRPPGRHTCAR